MVGQVPSGAGSDEDRAFGGRSGPVYAVFSGKVTTESGSPMPVQVAIKTDCNGVVQTHAYAAGTGEFTFTFSASNSSTFTNGFGLRGGNPSTLGVLQGCELFASGPGYTSSKIRLMQYSGSGAVDLGRIVLHPMVKESGTTVSTSSLAAPWNAQRECEKGFRDAEKGNLPSAVKHLQKAVQMYPKYAEAWTELGRIQLKQNDLSSAHQSFWQAMTADPKFLPPYGELTALAIQQKEWIELASTTNKVLEMKPDSFPQYWFFNSVANYNLQRFDQAEKSGMRGIALDQQHRFPKMEYLMGMIMVMKHNYREAAQHVRNYLRMSPSGSDVAMVRSQLANLEKLSARTEAGGN